MKERFKPLSFPAVFRVVIFALVAVLATTSLCLAKDAARPFVWAQPVLLKHSENFFRVSQDLYRAAQPTADAMRAYERFGIRTVINLRGLHSDKDEAKGTSLTLVELPTHTWKAGREEVAVRVLQAIRDAEKPVLIHCMHGADRTGMSVALYRMVEQGWSREEAIREMREGGFRFHSVWKNIPKFLEKADINAIRAALH